MYEQDLALNNQCYILSCGREMRMVAKQRTYRYSQ